MLHNTCINFSYFWEEMENICKNFQADYKIYVFYAWDNVFGPLKNDYDQKKGIF